MKISWFISTIAVSLIFTLYGYLSSDSTSTVMYLASGPLLVFTINLFFWLPVVVYLNANHKITLHSSLISSLLSATLGGASVIGVIVYFLSVNDVQYQSSLSEGSYTSWKIGHIHYLSIVIHIIILWGLNGIIFWKLYSKFATNKSLNRDAR